MNPKAIIAIILVCLFAVRIDTTFLNSWTVFSPHQDSVWEVGESYMIIFGGKKPTGNVDVYLEQWKEPGSDEEPFTWFVDSSNVTHIEGRPHEHIDLWWFTEVKEPSNVPITPGDNYRLVLVDQESKTRGISEFFKFEDRIMFKPP